MNRDNTMNEAEEYFQYHIPMFKGLNILNNPYITDVRQVLEIALEPRHDQAAQPESGSGAEPEKSRTMTEEARPLNDKPAKRPRPSQPPRPIADIVPGTTRLH